MISSVIRESAQYRILRGDALTLLRTLPDASIHCAVTSPPYFGLRDYGADGQIGLEATPEQYVARLVDVFREVRRVLRPDGTLWLNIGDSYANDAKWGGSTGGKHAGALHGNTGIGRQRMDTGLKPKDQIGIPWRLAFALQADGWWLRSDVIWHKPNPMPESVTDRPTKAHEYVFLLTKSERYFYDAQAIAEASIYPDDNRKKRSSADQKRMPTAEIAGIRPGSATYPTRNRRSVWTIATEPTPYAHFATMPTALVEPCILAGTSAHGVCPACGAPWARVVEREFTPQPDVRDPTKLAKSSKKGMDASNGWGDTPRGTTAVTTTGWSPTCECDADAPIPATVLDPFAGSGTTLRVAVNLGRRAIGIELNPEYVALAERLLGQTQPALMGV